MQQVPLFVRREVKDLRRAKIAAVECQNMARCRVRFFPVRKRKVLDLVSASFAADGGEEVPAPIMKSSVKAFTLAELLVVIAVIGVIAAIAIPAMSGFFGQADSAKTERNAQYLVSTFNAARAAGNSMSFANATEAIEAVTTSPGIPGRGEYASSRFYVPMDPAEVTKASTRISLGLAGTASEGSLTIER